MVEQTRREALSAAFDEAEKDEEVSAGSTAASSEPVVETPVVADKGESTPYEKEAAAAAKPADEGKPAAAKPADDGKSAEEVPGEEEDTTPAPISWRAEEKALWKDVPPSIRKVIQRRELETQRALSTSAQSRKFQEEFVRTVSPFAHLIRAQNSTPMAAVQNLMATAAGLMTGNSQQKAAIVAEIVANYGVDIRALDQALSQAPQNPNAGQASLPPQFAHALAPVYQFMEQVQTQRQTFQERQAAKAAEDIEKFGSDKPFFEDVREDMADIIEAGARRGKVITLEAAYKAAIAANPQFSDAVNQQRTQQQTLSEAAATLARARRAASTVVGAPNASTNQPATPANRRAQLAAAWDKNAAT